MTELLARATGELVTEDMRASFARDGYLVIDPGLQPELLDRAVADLGELYLPPGTPPDTSGQRVAYRDTVRVQDAWKYSAAVKAIALAPRVLQILEGLYGRRPRPFQTLNFRVGSEQRTHSDTIHFNSSPAGMMCGIWLALEDVDMDNGPLVYYPGSHKRPEVTVQDVDRRLQPLPLGRAIARDVKESLRRQPGETLAAYLRYEQHIEATVQASGIAPHYALLRRGQALIWAANLLHGGSPQADRARSRQSQVTHVFFEGSRYYTPLMSARWRKFWREPQWIT